MILIFDLCNELHLISPLDFLKGDFNTFSFKYFFKATLLFKI